MAHSLASDSMHPGGKLPPTLTPTGHFAGKPTLPISRSVTLIGARKQARLQLISSTVSQNHALIVNADSGPYIRDLASREHVFVNGIEVREGALADGDEIQVGRFTFRFNESPHTQPIEAVREIKPAPGGEIEISGADQPYPIQGKSILIGRRDLCEISLMEDSASTTHAIIFEMDGKRYIRDLASRTGTFVNGRQIHQVEINSGDEIKIGETTMRYVAEGAPARASESLRASAPAASAPAGDLSVGADDLMDLVEPELAPAPAPVPSRPTPQPKAVPPARKGPAPKPPEPVGPPAGAEALELVQDQPAETEDVELTPADLEVELEPLHTEPEATAPAPAAHEPIPMEVEPQPVDEVELEPQPVDEVELEPLEMAPAESPAAPTDELEIHDDRPQAAEDDLIDLLPRESEAAPAAAAPQAEDEMELEPMHAAAEEEPQPAAPPASPVEAETHEPEPSVQEQIERQPLHFSFDGMEPVGEEEIELEPAKLPAANEPIPVDVDHDIEIAPVAEPEAEPESPASIPVEAETHHEEAEPVAHEEEPESEEEFREVRARADDALALDSISPLPTVLPPSKFGPGASQLDLEPVGDIEADESYDTEEPEEPVDPEAEVEDEAPTHAESESEAEREAEPAPEVEEEQPQPEPVAEEPVLEEQPVAETSDDAASGVVEEQVGMSPQLAEIAAATESIDTLPDDLPELDADSVVMEFPGLDESEIAQLDFTAPVEGEPVLGADAFAVSDAPAAAGAMPLDLGAIDEEPIPDFTLPPVTEDEFKLDLADTIVGEQTPIFEMPPMPAAPAKKKPAAAPAAKAPTPAAKAAPAPAPVPPAEKKLSLQAPAPIAPPVPEAKAPVPTPPPVAKAPPAPPVPAPPKKESPAIKPVTVSKPPVVAPAAPLAPPPKVIEKPVVPAPVAEAPAARPQAAPTPPPMEPPPVPPKIAEQAPPAPTAPPAPKQKIEVLEPTESTPESALDLDEAIAERDSAPAVPEKALEVELTDSSFGRAVDSFVGESTTGPIVEDRTPEPVREPEPKPEPRSAPVPAARIQPPPPAPAPAPRKSEPIADEPPDELELELAPLEIVPAAETPAMAPPPPPPAPAPQPVVDEAPPETDEDGAFDLLESAEAPIAPAPTIEDKLFDLPLTPAAPAAPAAPALEEVELQLEPLPMADEAPIAPPPPRPQPQVAAPVPPALKPIEPVTAEIEEVESPAETIELELSDDAPPSIAKPAARSPGGISLGEPAPLPTGQTEDEVGDWGLELEMEEAEAPPAHAAPARPMPVEPVAEAPAAKPQAAPTPPPVAQPTPQPSAPGLDFNWGANQDHFLGGMPLQLHPVPPSRGPTPSAPTPSIPTAPAMPAAVAPAAVPPLPAAPVVPHAPVRPTQQSRVIDEPPPAPPAPPPRPVAEPIRPATPPMPQQQQRPPMAAPPPPRQPSVPRNPLAAEPAPPRQKSQVTTGFDGLALPVNETDVFGGLASGLGAFDQAPADDVFARRPSPAPQPPNQQQQQPPQQPPAGRASQRRGAGPARPAGAGDVWTPQNASPPPPTKPPHLGGDGGDNGGGGAGDDVSDSSDEISEIVLEDLPLDEGSGASGASPAVPSAASPPPPPAPRKKRRWFGLKSLIFLMMLSMAGATYAIWRTMPSKSSVTAQLQFANFGALPQMERKSLESEQRRYLADENLRINARSKVIAAVKGGNKTDPGFIDNAADYARTVSLAQLDMEKGIFSIPFVGGASLEDQTRMNALAQALYDANGKMIAEANDLNHTVDSLTHERDDAQKQIDSLSKQIEDLGAVAANGPTPADRAKMEADAATLEQTYKAAMANVTDLSERLKKLRENPAGVGDAATQPVGNDAVLEQLQGDLKKLNDRVALAQDDKSDKATAARAKLDAALAAFNQQIAQAQGAVKNNPELLAYVNNAQRLMGSSRDLIDQLIKRQQDQYGQLTDLKAKLNDKMLARRGELWKKDKDLVTLMDRKDITERQYNAAVGAGMTQQANEKKEELNLLDSQIKARQTLVADDGFYADAIDSLQKVIDTQQKGLEDDRRLTNQKLDEMQATFTASQPAVEKLTPEQKSLAEEMSKRLDEVTLARRQYTEAAAAANQQANDEMQNLQASASDLENKVQARKKELASATPAAPVAPPPPSPAAQKQAMDKLAGELAAAEKTRSEAEASYFAANKNLLSIKDKIEQARKAGEERDNLNRQKDIATQNFTQLDNQLVLKRTLAQQKTYPIAPTPADLKVDRQEDKRPKYTIFVCAVIFGFFVLLMFLTGTSREESAPAEPAEQAYLPEPGYEIEDHSNGHEDVFAQAPPRHEQQHQSPVEV